MNKPNRKRKPVERFTSDQKRFKPNRILAELVSSSDLPSEVRTFRSALFEGQPATAHYIVVHQHMWNQVYVCFIFNLTVDRESKLPNKKPMLNAASIVSERITLPRFDKSQQDRLKIVCHCQSKKGDPFTIGWPKGIVMGLNHDTTDTIDVEV